MKNNKSSHTIKSSSLYVFIGLMILIGSITTIANKLQSNSESLNIQYKHIWFITFCMFLGESICLIVHYMLPKIYNSLGTQENLLTETEETQSQEVSPYLFAVPAFCDFFGSTLMTLGLTMMAGSVYQMFRGSLIFFTASFSVIFLKTKLFRHHFFAMGIVILGLVLVGLSNKLFPNKIEGCPEEESQDSLWGIILVLIAQIFSASQFIIEEKILKTYMCPPLKLVGWEGVWGSLLYFLLLIVFQLIPCDVSDSKSIMKFICSTNDRNEWHLEDSIFALRQIYNNGSLLFYVILYIFSIAFSTFLSVSVTKYASSTVRSIVDALRTILVWAFFLMPFIEKCQRERFNFLQMIGFTLLVLGSIIYNEVITIKFFDLDRFTKVMIEERKANNLEKEMEELKKVWC